MEKKWLNETSFLFKNLVKLLGEKRVIKLYFLLVVEVLAMPWDDTLLSKLCVVDLEIGESLDSVNEIGEPVNNKKANRKEMYQKAYCVLDVFDKNLQGK